MFLPDFYSIAETTTTMTGGSFTATDFHILGLAIISVVDDEVKSIFHSNTYGVCTALLPNSTKF
jgi:hypothetical protein